MNKFFMHVSVGALALAAPLFTASNAFAAFTCSTSKGTVTIKDTTTCHFETAGGCESKCTPVSFTTTCSGTCDASATSTCTGTCESKCKTECTKQPDTFTCKDYCSVDCKAGCSSSCSGNQCSAQCAASCDTKCTEKCTVQTGATDCDTKCKNSCTGSCTVDANIKCDVDCATELAGGCKTKCSQPSGGLFCDDQYIDVSSVSDCNFEFSVKASGQLTGDLTASGCSSAPGTNTPFGMPAALAVVTGLGLIIGRRRAMRNRA